MPPASSSGSESPVYGRARTPGARSDTLRPATGRRAAGVAHAKDKGASKNVKKKAQKSVKEKRAAKREKKDIRSRTLGE
jgi:hypothetical protein